jgi:dolichyl-phosphate-mannose-protein mannosyltransferase
MTDLIDAPTTTAGPRWAQAHGSGVAPDASPKAVSPAPVGGTWSHRLRPLARPCGYYLLSRLGVYFAALVAKWLFPKLHPISALGSMWDGAWYIKIAEHGYPAHLIQEGDGSRWAFFPAWPAVLRATSIVTGLTLSDAAVVAAFVLGLTSVVAIWLAVHHHFGPTVADRSILLYVFFPMSFVLSMGYTEGLFLTAAGACLYSLSRQAWISAAAFAVLGSLTRDVGVFLILAVFVAALPELRRRRSSRPLAALAVAPLGLVAFMTYGWLRVGTPLAFMKAERFWHGAHFIWFKTPLMALATLIRGGLRGLNDPAAVLAVVALFFAWIGVVSLVRLHQRGSALPAWWWVFTLGALATAFSPYYPNSILRYTMAAFPLFAAYAWRIKPTWDGAIVGTMACAQAALTIVIITGTLHPKFLVIP